MPLNDQFGIRLQMPCSKPIAAASLHAASDTWWQRTQELATLKCRYGETQNGEWRVAAAAEVLTESAARRATAVYQRAKSDILPFHIG